MLWIIHSLLLVSKFDQDAALLIEDRYAKVSIES